MGPRARKLLIGGAVVGVALGELGLQMRSRCDNEALALELVRVEQLASTSKGLQLAGDHAVEALAGACPGQPDWVAYDLRSGFSWQIDAVVRHRSRSKFETWLTCETDGWAWWWEMPESVSASIAACGWDRLVPFTDAELERLRTRHDFNFWAAIAELERDGVDPSLLRRHLRVVLLAVDEPRRDFVITPGRIHALALDEPRTIELANAAAVAELVELLDKQLNEYRLLITADTSAGDLAWLHRIPTDYYDLRDSVFEFPWGVWTLDERGPSGMPIRAEARLVDNARVTWRHSDSPYVVLRLEVGGWRLDGGPRRPYSELDKQFGDRPLRVAIEHDVGAGQFMPVLDRLHRESGGTSALMVAVE